MVDIIERILTAGYAHSIFDLVEYINRYRKLVMAIMTDFFSFTLIEQLGWPTICLICFAALVTSSIHGATGVAGGFLLSAALAPIIGVKPIVPVLSVALLISHITRALLNFKDFDRKAFLYITVPAFPCIIGGALLYSKMSAEMIAVFLGLVILISIPIRHWARTKEIKVGKFGLNAAGLVYGGLSGASIGSGMLLVPFMLGYGLNKHAFVGTLAVIALTTNVIRVSVFGSADLLVGNYLPLGIFIGLVTIPGNWFGRSVLRRISNEKHGRFVDVLSVFGALNFFWLALAS